jgi:hypothetical protein
MKIAGRKRSSAAGGRTRRPRPVSCISLFDRVPLKYVQLQLMIEHDPSLATLHGKLPCADGLGRANGTVWTSVHVKQIVQAHSDGKVRGDRNGLPRPARLPASIFQREGRASVIFGEDRRRLPTRHPFTQTLVCAVDTPGGKEFRCNEARDKHRSADASDHAETPDDEAFIHAHGYSPRSGRTPNKQAWRVYLSAAGYLCCVELESLEEATTDVTECLSCEEAQR